MFVCTRSALCTSSRNGIPRDRFASRRTGLLLLAAALLPFAAAYGVPRQPPQQVPSYQQTQQEISPILFPSESGPEQQKVSAEN